MKKMKLLAVCDSPTVHTGFGRVAQNLLARWFRTQTPDRMEPEPSPLKFDAIDVWGINYHGLPHGLPYRIWPAHGENNEYWHSPGRLQALLNLIMVSDYTHVWIMQDTFHLAGHDFPQMLKLACDKKGIRSLLYFPVDAELEPEWTEIIKAVDQPVAYTGYGHATAMSARMGVDSQEEILALSDRTAIIPHGVDQRVYRRLPERDKLRAEIFKGWIQPGDILLMNVSQNQRRKDVPRCLELIAALRDQDKRFKLYLHMHRVSADGTDLDLVGKQLGLESGVDWVHGNDMFSGGLPQLSEEMLNVLYNCADGLLTTTLGEGFGLPLIEAAAAGCMVIAPRNTACLEIMQKLDDMGCPTVPLTIEHDTVAMPFDNGRLRRRVYVPSARDRIKRHWAFTPKTIVTDWTDRFFDWDRIAKAWLELFFREEKRALAAPSSSSAKAAEDGSSDQPSGQVRKFTFRPGTCDAAVWHNVVTLNEYRLPEAFAAGDVVIDIGAHIGAFAYAAASRGARVIAFECSRENYELARRNLAPEIASGQVEIYNVAVWRSDVNVGFLTFTGHPWHEEAKEVNTGGGNVLWGDKGEKPEKVPCLRLDDILWRKNQPFGEEQWVRLLKLDCEGSEWPILYSADLLSNAVEICGEFHEVEDREMPPELQAMPKFKIKMLQEVLIRRGFKHQVSERHGQSNIGLFWSRRG